MPDDEIVTLETGEQVKVTDEGERILIPGTDPEVQDMIANRLLRQGEQESLRQARAEEIEHKRARQLADPGVPPEKTIF